MKAEHVYTGMIILIYRVIFYMNMAKREWEHRSYMPEPSIMRLIASYSVFCSKHIKVYACENKTAYTSNGQAVMLDIMKAICKI